MADKARFEQAQKEVQTLSQRPSNDDMLELYSLYKQGSQGDVSGKRPGALNMVARAKYDAWAKRKGMSQDEAMDQYVGKVEELLKTHK